MLKLFQNGVVRRLEELERFGGKLPETSLKSRTVQTALLALKKEANSNRVTPLLLRAASLCHRVENLKDHQSKNKEVDKALFLSLKLKASEWKRNDLVFSSDELSLTDESKLEELARYPLFAALLLKDKKALHDFFKWSLKNSLSVPVFVEFPGIAKKVDQSLLKARIGAFGGEGLKFCKNPDQKDVTLLFEGKEVSVLDPSQKVHFTSGTALKVNQVFQMFKRKNLEEGHLTYFQDGIFDWDPNRLAPKGKEEGLLKGIDLSKEDWHKELPILRRMTKEEAADHFSLPCDGKQWVMNVVATRQSKRLDTFGSHCFFRLAIPEEDGSYRVTYGWGKFTKRYPQNPLDSLGFLFAPKHGVVQYPDNNEIYTSRDRVEKNFLITPEKGFSCLQSLRDDMLRAERGHFPFQILADNCTDWVVDKVRRFAGEEESRLFDMSYRELDPRPPLSGLVKVLRRSSDQTADVILSALSFVLGGWRRIVYEDHEGKKISCLLLNKPWKRKVFHHPGALFKTFGK